MGRFKKVLGDVRTGRFLEAYSGILLALVVIVVNVAAGFVPNADRVAILVSTTIIFLLSIITLATIEIRRDMPSSGERAKVTRFFPSRGPLPTLQTQLEECHRQAHIFGLQLNQVSHTLLPMIERRVADGLIVKLALLSPVDRQGTRLDWIDDIGAVHCFPNLDELLRGSLRRLRTWHAALPPDLARKVIIRAYTEVPTASVAIYDPDSRHGYVHVEPILYMFNPDERPSFWVRRSDDDHLFTLLLQRYEQLWNNAIPIEQLVI
jgi:hypothetical protein